MLPQRESWEKTASLRLGSCDDYSYLLRKRWNTLSRATAKCQELVCMVVVKL
ncbi:MAG: hypothetical protein QXJ21_09085 [Thermofilum sp.]